MTQTISKGGKRIPLIPILTVNFVGTLGFSIVLPFLIFLVTRWGGNALIYGIMGATYSGFQLIGAPILGRWSDVYGRKKVLLLSQLGTLLSWLILLLAFLLPVKPLLSVNSGTLGNFVLTLPLVVMFVARAADGLTGGNVSVANAYLADITTDENRSADFGKMAVSSNLGFILGPAIAGLLGGTLWGERAPVTAAVVISLFASLIIAYKLPESRSCVLRTSPERGNVRKVFGHEPKDCVRLRGAVHLTSKEIFQLPGVPVLLSIYFLVMLGFNFFYIAFPVYAVRALSWSVVDTGIFFSVMGLLMVLVQGPVLGYAGKRLTERSLVLMGSILLAASFLLFDSFETWRLYLGVALMALGNGLMWPSVLAILSKVAGEAHQGAVQGFAGSSGAVASIVGLVAGGLLFGALEGKVFWISSITILIVLLLATISLPKTEVPGVQLPNSGNQG